MFFHASCSQPLVLKNVFGTTQVVQFANPSQGNVSCFIATEVFYMISVPVNLLPGDRSIIIHELNIHTNYTNPVYIDFGPMVDGTIIGPGRPPLEVSFEATINLAIPQAYETILFVSGETVNNSQPCTGNAYDTFFAPSNEGPPTVPGTPSSKKKSSKKKSSSKGMSGKGESKMKRTRKNRKNRI